MDIALLSHLLGLRVAWRSRDRWSAGQIAGHQEQALRELRRAAYSGSEFYRRHHAGLLDAPLEQLPVVTKADLMANFDQAVTVPGLRLADVEVLVMTARSLVVLVPRRVGLVIHGDYLSTVAAGPMSVAFGPSSRPWRR